MHDIHTRLLRAEDDLYSALSSGALAEFQNGWSKLSHDIVVAVQGEELSDAVRTLARTVATRIHSITAGLLQLNTKTQELMKEQHSDDKVLVTQSFLPPYIPLAYKWLLDNLHCPYPSTPMRNSLAESSGSSRKAIDAWFIDVRKRIGWNALRKSRFSGKKDDIIRAATKFFRTRKWDVSLASDFAPIELAAKALYAEKLHPTTLGSQVAVDIDSVASKQYDGQISFISDPNNVYPSPRSLTSSLPSSPIIPPLQSIPTSNPVVLKRTREELTAIDSHQRPPKRQRLCPTSSPAVSSCGTPEPQTSIHDRLHCRSLSGSTSTFRKQNDSQVALCRYDSSRCPSPLSREVTNNSEESPETGRVVCPLQKSSILSQPRISHSEGLCSEVQEEQNSRTAIPQADHRRRCFPENRLQFPSTLQNNLPHLHSASHSSIVDRPCGWSCDPENIQSAAFDPLDDLTAYDVATFDFSTYSFHPPVQTKGPLAVLDAEEVLPPISVTSQPLVVSPPVDTFNTGLSEEGFLDLLNFLPSGSSLLEANSTIPSTSTLPFSHGAAPSLAFDFGPALPDANETFDWNTPSDVENLFDSLVQSPIVQEESTSSFWSQEEKAKKLKLLADLREAQQRLEAEIAAM